VRVLHVAPSVDPSRGGPARSVPALAVALRAAGVDAKIAAAGIQGDGNIALAHWRLRGEIPDARSRAALADAIGQADLVEIHSLWNGTTSMAAAICRRHHVPYVLTPRGMLDPSCLSRRRRLKQLYWWTIDRATVEGASGFHFLTEEERDRAVMAGPLPGEIVTIAPNGAPDIPADLPAHVLRQKFPDLDGRKVVLHLGRLHPIKGVDFQVKALARIPELERPVLLLVGPDHGAAETIRTTIRDERLEPWVRWGGEIYGAERFALLAEADAVVMTSLYDCNPVVATEAMAVGAALVATEECALGTAQRHGAAVVVRREPGVLASEIQDVMTNRRRTSALRAAARQFATTHLAWPRVVTPLLTLYQRLVGMKAEVV
jgi:glycosyltransferase involved in cell wall biosynthesis